MIWRNLNASNSTIYRVFRELSKELAEPLGSAEPRLKNTGLAYCIKKERDLPSISSTFYEQLLRTQILNAQKRQSSQQCCLALLGPTGVKAVGRTLMKLTLGDI